MDNDIEFDIEIAPHRAVRGPNNKEHVVYDIHVTDAQNGKTLVFSNQGYENRQDAVDLAIKLFAGKRAEMRVLDADRSLYTSYLMATFMAPGELP